MTSRPRQPDPRPIGETLRERRVVVMNKSLRETAKLLDIAPAHLTDIEKGRRNPSQDLLLRVAKVYGIDEATLRAGWGKAEIVVGQIASKNPTTAAKAPELLRAASDLSAEQWDKLIAQARSLASKTSTTAKTVTKKKAT
ncbi:MAG: helix-turn-helix domain-containing protein [Phycisphaerales bacterium]